MELLDIDVDAINRTNFRNCLEALSRPGTLYGIMPLFGSGLLGMASVFLYSEVGYHCSDTLDFEIVAALTGAGEKSVEKAEYLFSEKADLGLLQRAKVGSGESPEGGATIIFGCETMDSGVPVVLSGPGIDGLKTVFLPVDRFLIDCFLEKNREFPLGVDLFLVDPTNRIMGLPRTVKIEVA